MPDYVWPDPNNEGGWIDAWNGAYATEGEARADGAGGIGTPWVLQHGDGLITEAEAERRRAAVPGPTTAVIAFDGVDPEELEADGAGPMWRVASIDIVRDGVVLATLQVTPRDIVVFPGACHDIGVIRNGERATITDRSVGIYGS